MAQAIGIEILLKCLNWPGIITSAIAATTVGTFSAALTFSYRLVILPDHSHELFYINSTGTIAAFTLAAVAIAALRPSADPMDASAEATPNGKIQAAALSIHGARKLGPNLCLADVCYKRRWQRCL